MKHVHLGTDRTALSIEVNGVRSGFLASETIFLEGAREAEITALIVARTMQLTLERSVSPGVWHLDQVFELVQYREDLEAAEFSIR